MTLKSAIPAKTPHTSGFPESLGKCLPDKHTAFQGFMEDAFFVSKYRPIGHWTAERVRAHIAICFLAYSLPFVMRYRLERAGLRFNLEELREILQRDQYSILKDQRTGKRYHYPSVFTEPIKRIYEALGLKRVSEVRPLP